MPVTKLSIIITIFQIFVSVSYIRIFPACIDFVCSATVCWALPVGNCQEYGCQCLSYTLVDYALSKILTLSCEHYLMKKISKVVNFASSQNFI
jgi:hypothetical protein